MKLGKGAISACAVSFIFFWLRLLSFLWPCLRAEEEDFESVIDTATFGGVTELLVWPEIERLCQQSGKKRRYTSLALGKREEKRYFNMTLAKWYMLHYIQHAKYIDPFGQAFG